MNNLQSTTHEKNKYLFWIVEKKKKKKNGKSRDKNTYDLILLVHWTISRAKDRVLFYFHVR